MANIKFSAFTTATGPGFVDFIVGYQAGTNVKITPADLIKAGGTGLTEYIPRWADGPNGILGDSIMIQQAAAGVFSSDYIEVSGTGGLSTQNLEVTADLYDGAAGAGAAGDILSSLGAGNGISWVTPGTGINIVTDITTAVGISTGDPIDTLTNATGAVTITLNEYAGAANEGFVPSGGIVSTYLDGSGAWSTPPGVIPWPYQYDAVLQTFILGHNPGATGAENTGLYGLLTVTSGERNTAIGEGSGGNLTQGNNNVFVGFGAEASAANAENQIVIGSVVTSHGDNTVVIGNNACTVWEPDIDNQVDLGSTTYSFKDAYIEGVYYDTAGNAGNAGEVLSSTAAGTSWIPASVDGVTSAGLTMPAAFSVTGSPITSSGTFAVTGAGAATDYIDGTGALQTRWTGTTAQYYRGDGTLAAFTQLWNPPAIILGDTLTFWNSSNQLDSSNELTFTTNGSTNSKPTIGMGLFGAANSKGAFELNTWIDYNGSPFDYFLYTGAGGPFQNFAGVGTFAISIHAAGRFMGSGIHIYSDERIKKDISVSNSKEDLETISKIEISDYKYIDPGKGTGDHKKVIAQQVEEHYPMAVKEGKEIIPDVFKQTTIKNGVIDLAFDCKIGDKVKLIYPGNDEEIVDVVEVNEDNVKVASDRTSDVIVYGKEVDDYKTVDYDALAMLNISATQELHKIIKELKKEIELLKK